MFVDELHTAISTVAVHCVISESKLLTRKFVNAEANYHIYLYHNFTNGENDFVTL